MKKAVLASFVILCLLFILSLRDYKISVEASSTTWTVDDDGPANFRTIQDAINNATSGDTIFVHMGTYWEHIVVNKSIALVGESRDYTIIDGNGTDNVISIRADTVSVEGFTIKKSGIYPYSGICIEPHIGNFISNNKIIDNYEGISLYYSSNNVISANILSNNYDGIYLHASSNNVLSGNTISSNNYGGISLYASSNNVLSGNTISSNNYGGISLYASSNNVLSGNNVLSNSYYGIILALLSTNNTIYLNNFNNTAQVLTDSTNVWTYGGEGNYWSDYKGQDLNEDGIGDNPYVIDENNQDIHPLMGMFSCFPFMLERETYYVTIISNSTISDFRFEIGNETGNKIIRFNTAGKYGSVGFSRVMIPIELMKYPYIALVDSEEVIPTLLDTPNKTYACLYFTYSEKNHSIKIISSKTLLLYYEMLDSYFELQKDLYNLNETYYDLLNSYTILSGNYSQLQKSFGEMNASFQQHLFYYSEQAQNTRSIMYIFAATTGIVIITIIYLSKSAHVSITTKTKVIEEVK